MRITISGNRITVRAWGRDVLAAEASEITAVAVRAGAHFTPPRLASALVDAGARLNEIVLTAGDRNVRLSKRARGFGDLVTWLTQQGWAMGAAIEEANRTPFVRVAAKKV